MTKVELLHAMPLGLTGETSLIVGITSGVWPFRRRRVERYRGRCTVWHDAHTAKRAPTWLEAKLCDFWTLSEWEGGRS